MFACVAVESRYRVNDYSVKWPLNMSMQAPKRKTPTAFGGGGAETALKANTPAKARVVRVEAKPGMYW